MIFLTLTAWWDVGSSVATGPPGQAGLQRAHIMLLVFWFPSPLTWFKTTSVSLSLSAGSPPVSCSKKVCRRLAWTCGDCFLTLNVLFQTDTWAEVWSAASWSRITGRGGGGGRRRLSQYSFILLSKLSTTLGYLLPQLRSSPFSRGPVHQLSFHPRVSCVPTSTRMSTYVNQMQDLPSFDLIIHHKCFIFKLILWFLSISLVKL